MSHLRVLICRVDDADHPDQMTELHGFDLPAVELETLTPATALDKLETASSGFVKRGAGRQAGATPRDGKRT